MRLIIVLAVIVAWSSSATLLPAEVTKLRLGATAATSTEKVIFALAKDAGILKKHNLELEVILITSGGTLAMQALVGNSLDLLTTGATPFLHGYLEGAEVKIIGGVNNRLAYTLVARGNIMTVAQLKGKMVGITRFGSIDELATKTALSQLGLNPKTDVRLIQIGGSANRLAALYSGAIDASSLASGYSYVARKSGFHVLWDFVDKDFEYMMTGIVARNDFLKNRSDAVRRFLRAYIGGIHYYKSHREEAIKKTQEAIRTDDRQIAETDYSYRARALPDDGRPTFKGMQWAIDEMAKENPKARGVTPEQVIDLNFLP